MMGSEIQNQSSKAEIVDKPRERLISMAYFLLRGSTAGAAFAMGFVQTFVFARILSPERFSVFILVGAVGYTLWITDLGLAKIVFVNLRNSHLSDTRNVKAAEQATAVILFYGLLAVGASFICFVIAATRPGATIQGAAELALFFGYIALNLAWFSLRSVSIAVDLQLYYEKLELARRALNITMMFSMLAGLPLLAFLIGSNLLWGLLFTVASIKLIQHGALVPELRSLPRNLTAFCRENWHAISRSSTGALSSVFTVTFPYYIVPIWFGLGAAPIIVEVTFRIFRGACVIFAAICDLAIPGQTRAFAAGDGRRLIRTTLLVGGLCCIPAALACGLLIFENRLLFKFLLSTAVDVPPTLVPVLVVLLLASVVQIVSEALLQYTGFFRSLAYNGAGVAIAMVLITGIAALLKVDLIGFLAAYAIVFAAGGIFLAAAAVLGPFRATAAHSAPAATATEGMVRALRSVLPVPDATPVPQHRAHKRG